MFVDDAHSLTESKLVSLLHLKPQRLVLTGSSLHNVFGRVAISHLKLGIQFLMKGSTHRLFEHCFYQCGRESNVSERIPQLESVQSLIGNLILFDLQYLREIGARKWQDLEEVYFIAELLSQLSAALFRLEQGQSFKQRSFGKLQIAICVPFEWMIRRYN